MKHTYALWLMLAVCTSCHRQAKIELSKDDHSKQKETLNEGVEIQNSLPKGGVAINGKKGYTDPGGKTRGFGIFWTRVTNKSATPLILKITFPADSFAIPNSPKAYFKLLLPPDTITLAKQSLYNYGYKTADLKSFLDTSFNQPSLLQRTINPHEAFLFYVVMLIHVPDNGPVRAGFVLKDGSLFYKVSIAGQLDATLFPCGEIAFNPANH
jgi:hypothetical protein